MSWSPENVDLALTLIETHGVTRGVREAATTLGKSVNAVRQALYERHHERYKAACQKGAATEGLRAIGQSLTTDEEWFDKFRPIALPAPAPYRGQMSTASNTTLIAGDFHFPKEDERTVAVFLKTVAELKPHTVILNGDTVDLLAVSKYSKDQRHTWTLRDEAEAFHRFLHQLETLGQGWGLRVVETEANHSGDGVASRWHRYLSDRAPHLYTHPKAAELLDYRTWWYPAWSGITLVEDVVLCGDLLVTHGDIVRKNPAYSARAHAEKYHASVLHSHTHRMGMGIDRIPAIGDRPEATRRSYEIGCMCDINPSYAKNPNWVNGFAIVVDNGEHYNVELVPVEHGVAVVNTLEATVRA